MRGKGLMIGVELVRDRQTKERAVEERNALVQAMFRRGVLILGAGRNAVRLRAPARPDDGSGRDAVEDPRRVAHRDHADARHVRLALERSGIVS